jgi:hypothetical protein
MANCLIYREDLHENSAPTQKDSQCGRHVRHIRDVKHARDYGGNETALQLFRRRFHCVRFNKVIPIKIIPIVTSQFRVDLSIRGFIF